MKRLGLTYVVAKCALYLLLASACTRASAESVDKIPAGTEVTVMTKDGTLVRGKIATVDADVVKLTGDSANSTTEITRTSIAEVKRVDADRASSEETVVRTITIPDNTVLDVTLNTSLSSETSRVEERVNGTVNSPVVVDGITAIPAGSALSGHVTNVKDSGKVKGRAELAFSFNRLRAGSVTYDIDTKPLHYIAESTKKDDAVKIGIGAGAGAVIGAITGGKKGAAIGSAIGGGAGTGVVLATEGKDVSLAEGRKLKVSLTNPLTIRTK
jgi:hypothetical protein